MYGPEFPIHDSRYLQCRGIPKLLSEKTEMFRFFSCKFRVSPSKETTARVVLWREFKIANCFTLEASFHGFFNSERITLDFLTDHLKEIGMHLNNSLFEFAIMLEAEERQQKEKRERLRQIAAARSTKKNKKGESNPNVLPTTFLKMGQKQFKDDLDLHPEFDSLDFLKKFNV